MKFWGRLLFISVLILSSCASDEPEQGIYIFSKTFNFNEDQYNWQGGFSDYPIEKDSALYALKYAYTKEPSGDNSIMLSGNNLSYDLFMFLKKQLTGLQPNTDYILTFDVEFVSDAWEDSSGASDSPGGSVFLKVGASGIEPKSFVDHGSFIMNIDKGNQMDSGNDMITIGNIAVSTSSIGYTKINRTNSSSKNFPLKVRSNSNGELWLIVGTDSAYGGTTTLYYTKINVVLSSSK